MAYYAKRTSLDLDAIEEVYAVKKGYNTKELDMTHYAIIMEFRKEIPDRWNTNQMPRVVKNKL
eukprot:CAMPEP_0116878984 /NCGR_PEP_ID=MMETSP0463-20121206/10738_1 /TAXON_ID=181622 /ORGANISM="Strombidinopsis sp, Strain SopsisLIS2011" /LENGTH=62 /DNA_ID=CAMNT_0004527759 /DNA_START=388 /DNA_END=576 /DNA_ORIENTATION=+